MKVEPSTGMVCPTCRAPHSEVLDMRPLKSGRWIKRRRSCAACGLRWKTYEKVAPDPEFSFHHTTGSQSTSQQIDGDLAIRSEVTSQSVGKKGFGVSGSGLVSSDLLPGLGADPDPSLSEGDQGVDPARAKPAKGIDYPRSFEVLWDETGKRGGKYVALKAWIKVGRPSWDAIGARWNAYLLSERPRAGFIKDLSSWLNGRGHEQDWAPAPPPAHDTRCTFHRNPANDGRASKFPVATCPRCKHFAARDAGRASEPTSVAGALPNWATAPPPTPWTPEQTAEAERLRRKQRA